MRNLIHPRRPASARPVQGRRLALALAFVLVVAAGCSRDDASHAGTSAEVRLKGEVLSESETFGQPGDLAVVGPHLVMTDGFGEPAIHVIRASDGAVERAFGRKGKGPGEFDGIRSIDPVPGSASEFWVYDQGLRRMTHVDLAAGPDAGAPGSRSLTFSAGELPMSPAWVGREIVSPGIFRGGRLARYDTAGRRIAATGRVPEIPDRKIPVEVLQHAFTGTLVADPGRRRLVLGTRHSDRLEFYRASGEPLRTVRGPTPFEPAFEVRALNGTPYMASGDDMRFGYVDVYAKQERVYALFSGRTRAGFPGRAVFAETVHEYDWSGKLLRVLKLDADVLSIAVDADGRKLYATRWTPAPAVLVYELQGG